MKHTLLIIISLITLTGYSQKLEVDKNSGLLKIEKVIDAPAQSKLELYQSAKIWLAESFVSSKAVIEESDTSGIIIGNYIDKYRVSGPAFYNFRQTITIKLKDSKAKVIITRFENIEFSNRPAEDYILKKDGSFRDMYSGFIESIESNTSTLIESLTRSLNRAKDNDW